MEIHVFDFDSTLFHSPAPDENFVRSLYGITTLNRLYVPLSDKGLGWFQSIHSLSPPVVPENPDLAQWYVTPVVEQLRAVAARKPHPPLIYVLTGRDQKYRQRIVHLLDHAGLLQHITEVFLKPHEVFGTIKFKMNKFFTLLMKHNPAQFYYYEDNLEMGGRLVESFRYLQTTLYGKADFRVLPLPEISSGDQETAGAEGAEITVEDLFKHGRRHRCATTVSAEDGLTQQEGEMVEEATSAAAATPSPSPAQERAVRQAKRWMEGTIQFYNRHDCHPQSGAPEKVSFRIPPPFRFTLFIVPREHAGRADSMLSTAQTQALVDRLINDRKEYDGNGGATASEAVGRGQRDRGRGGRGDSHGRGGRGDSDGRGGRGDSHGRGGRGDSDGRGGRGDSHGRGGRGDSDGRGDRGDSHGRGGRGDSDGRGDRGDSHGRGGRGDSDGRGGRGDSDGRGGRGDSHGRGGRGDSHGRGGRGDSHGRGGRGDSDGRGGRGDIHGRGGRGDSDGRGGRGDSDGRGSDRGRGGPYGAPHRQ